jgi:hypothetical protein
VSAGNILEPLYLSRMAKERDGMHQSQSSQHVCSGWHQRPTSASICWMLSPKKGPNNTWGMLDKQTRCAEEGGTYMNASVRAD